MGVEAAITQRSANSTTHFKDNMKLTGKVVVITGSSRGLGASLARACAGRGAKVVVSARTVDELRAIAKATNGIAVRADVTNEAQVHRVADEAIQRLGQIDVWINNAGVRIPRVAVEDMDVERVRKMMDVNFFGTLFGSKAALKYMKPQGRGVIMNVLSTSALEGVQHSTGYGASKGAAIAFTKSLRVELQPQHIQVIGIYPPGMRTHFFDEKKPDDYEQYLDPDGAAKQVLDNLESDQPESEFFIKKQ